MKTISKILIFAILATFLLCVAAFFVNVKNITVVDNRYVSEEVIKDKILSTKRKDKLLFIYIKNLINNGDYNIPHVENIKLKFANGLKLEAIVKEKPVLGYIKKIDKYYYFDEDMYIVYKSDARDEEKIEVVGLNTSNIEVGEYITREKTNIDILFIVKSINNFLTRNGLLIDDIEIMKSSDIVLVKDRLSFNLGSIDYIEEKLSLVLNTYGSIRDMSGVLDLSKVNTKDDRGEYVFKKK